MLSEFVNEPYADFSQPDIREAQEKAISHVESQFGKKYELMIDGNPVKSDRLLKSYNPANKDQVV